MATNTGKRYDDEFKSSLVTLYQNGKTQTQLCKEYGVSQTALSKWIKQYSTVEVDHGEVLTAKQVKELQKRNAQLEEENLILKKSDCHLHATLKERLTVIHKLRFQHDIKTLCRALQVNRSTYYKHFHSEPSHRTKETMDIKRIILQIYSDYDNFLGAYKITYILSRDYGINISVGRVYRLMQSRNLPKISTDKPRRHAHKVQGSCNKSLAKKFQSKGSKLSLGKRLHLYKGKRQMVLSLYCHGFIF